MDYSLGGDDDDENNNEYAEMAENQEEPEYSQKDAILFVVDARKGMCEPGANGSPSPLAQALGCVQASMQRRVQSGDTDLIGLLLFGTKQQKAAEGGLEFPFTYLQQGLEQPTGRAMRELQGLKTADGEYACGHMDADDDLAFENVLWVISMVFNADSRAKSCRKRVYLMTNDPDPSRGDAGSRKRALTRGNDLQQAHVWMEPFFFPPAPPATFDLSEGSFWAELVSSMRAGYKPAPASEGESEPPAEDTSDAWKTGCLCGTEGELLDRVTRKQHRKRTLGKVELLVGEGTTIALNLLRLISEFKKPTAKKVYAKDLQLLKSDTVYVCAASGSRLSKQDMWRGFDFGGHWVYFGPDELRDATSDLCPAGLQLLGFHARDRLKPYHNLGAAYFAEPCERRREGSALALEALVGSMVRKGKVGFGTLTTRGKPQLVAMLPQPLELDSKGAVLLPCGLHLVPLPYADDLRKLSLPPPLAPDELSEAQQECASKLVAALTLPPETNPAGRAQHPGRHKHFAFIQAKAIQAAEVEPTVDGTLPDEAWLGARAGEVRGFKEAFGVPEPDEIAQPAGGAAKKPKAEKAAVPETTADWLQCWQERLLDKQTVPVLKEFCKSRELPVGGKKDDLVKRVHAKLEEIAAEEANAVSAVKAE